MRARNPTTRCVVSTQQGRPWTAHRGLPWKAVLLLLGCWLVAAPSLAFAEEAKGRDSHLPVDVFLELGSAPFTFAGADGHPRGMAVEFWQQWGSPKQTVVSNATAQVSARRLRIRLAPLHRAITMLRDGTGDAVLEFPHLGIAPKGLRLGRPYAQQQLHLFFSQTLPGLTGLGDLAGQRLGVVLGHPAARAVGNRVPFGTAIVQYDTIEAMITGALLGEVQAFVAPRAVAAHYLAARNGLELFSMVPDPILTLQLSVLVREADAALLAGLEAGLTPQLLAAREEILQRWSGETLERVLPWRIMALLAGGILLIVLFFLAWNRQLQRRVRQATAQLVAVNEALEEEVETRRKAEAELASLNTVLETRIVERTKALGEKASQLQNAYERLQRVDEAKTAFLAAVSHELRTPLTSMRGFSKLIRRDFERIIMPALQGQAHALKRAERIEENLIIMEQEGERLTRLINDYLDLARIESGRISWRDQEIDPAQSVQRAVRAVAGRFAEKSRLDLHVEVESQLPALTMDPDRLEQVLINLLSNAIKFTQEGEVRLEVATHGEAVRFAVSDTGVGVPEVDKTRIFDKFERILQNDDTLHSSDAVGTGLGLSISKQIVEHYRGAIWVESALGVGSTFFFDIPVSSTGGESI